MLGRGEGAGNLVEFAEWLIAVAPRTGAARLWAIVPSSLHAHELQQLILDRGAAIAGLEISTAAQCVDRLLAESARPLRPKVRRSSLLAWLEAELTRLGREAPLLHGSERRYLRRFASARRLLLSTIARLRIQVDALGLSAPSQQSLALALLPRLGEALESAGLDDRACRWSALRNQLSETARRERLRIPERVLALLSPSREDHETQALLSLLATHSEVEVFAAARADGFANGARLRAWSAASIDAELDEIAARVRHALAEGCPPHEIAIVPLADDYVDAGALARLTAKGLPLARGATSSLRAHESACLAMRLLRLALGGAPRADLIDALANPRFDLEGLARRHDGRLTHSQLARLDRETRRSGVLGGKDALLRAFDEAFAPRTEEAQEGAPRSTPAAAQECTAGRRVLEGFFAELAALETAVSDARKHTQIANAVLAALSTWVSDAHEELWRAIASFAQRDALGLGRPDPERTVEAIEACLAEAQIACTEVDREGVRIVPLSRTTGLGFRRVFVAGISRDRFPPSERALELRREEQESIRSLRSARLEELGLEHDHDTLDSEASIAEQELADLLANCSESVDFSWTRANVQGQARSPAPVLRRIAHDNDGKLEFDTLPAATAERLADRIERGLDLDDDEVAVFAAAARGPDGLLAAAERLGLGDELAPACDWLAARESFAAAAAAALRFDALELGPSRLLGERLSVSALERLARCPQEFYASRVLRAEALEDEPRRDRPAHILVGLIVHDLFEQVVRRMLEMGLFDRGLDERICRARESLIELFDARCRALLTEQERQLPLLGNVELARWRESLLRVLEADLRELDALSRRPVDIERRIVTKLALGESQAIELLLEARIDRIDADSDGTPLIRDYKTGSLGLDAQSLGKEALAGTRLQLPLYAMALAKQDGLETMPSAELRGVAPRHLVAMTSASSSGLSGESDANDTPPRRALEDEVWRNGGLDETLGIVAGLLRDGNYPPRKSKACDWCRYRTSCARNHPPSVQRGRITALDDFARLSTKSLQAGRERLHPPPSNKEQPEGATRTTAANDRRPSRASGGAASRESREKHGGFDDGRSTEDSR